MAHYMGYRFTYLLARTSYRMAREPAAAGMVWGYLAAVGSRRPRYADEAVRRHLRRQQGVGALPPTYAADVFSDVLNDPQSQFQQKLVDSGLWQAVGVNYYTLNHTGPITISGQTLPEQLRDALAALYGEIAKFDAPGYFSAEELEAVKAHRAVTSAFDRERASGFAHTLGFWWSVASLEYYMGYVDYMAQQTIDDLRAYARRYILGKPHIAGVLIAPDARQSIKLAPNDLITAGTR